MNKTVLMAASAVIALSLANDATAAKKPSLVAHASNHAMAHKFSASNRSLNVLYDQNGSDSGIAVVSQNFESSFDAYDSQSADDFVIEGSAIWRVRELDITGQYFNGSGPMRSATVLFYQDDKMTHLPGALVREYDNLTPSSDNFGSLVINLPHAIGLHHGRHWVSVIANMDFAAGGEWGWENQLDVVGYPAAWRNPGGGFGCPSWDSEQNCLGIGVGDKMFTLKGTSRTRT